MDVEAINTNLLRAVEKGNWFTVREAIHEVQASNGIHDWSFLSKNLVERACDRGDEEIMGLLVRMCSQEDFTDLSKRTTILHRAVRRRGGRYGIVRLLLDSALSERSESVKEYVNIQDHEGKTALHHVAVSGDSYMLDILCKAGADVNIRDERNLLPAHIACIAGEYEMMRRLFGKDRMSITQVMHHEEVAGSAPIHLVAERNCWKELVYLMDLFQKENIQAKDINYELAWYKACRGTSRLYSTPAYSGMAQGFPNSLEAAIVLIYNEYRRPLTYDQPDWKEYSFPGITCYSFQINHVSGYNNCKIIHKY
ncbi:hypothetical protein COCMIDRAFT_28679 [Bipolaris oryzae ATCC 44560]|uniref:Uncharacterized protein n=1 Tax=Bipolaris oryzae ATCC 44560 TaxID=930090 RepID=W6YTI6_COCMI|nr:uncharacterized protein COCMIDRAFT_28679 [Bipolaris oryzae ATCC 44560]EUC42767.1 hypothetical protein COCMIDRAFT_28679 [Bipolaris oryzae ATCC 44560]